MFILSTAEKDAVIDDKEFERRFQQEARISIFKEDEHCEPAFVQVSTGKRLKYDILDSKEVKICTNHIFMFFWETCIVSLELFKLVRF